MNVPTLVSPERNLRNAFVANSTTSTVGCPLGAAAAAYRPIGSAHTASPDSTSSGQDHRSRPAGGVDVRGWRGSRRPGGRVGHDHVGRAAQIQAEASATPTLSVSIQNALYIEDEIGIGRDQYR